MKNLGDYQDHFLKKDVLLLAEVFEKFINICLKFYKIDPSHYFSSPELSWDAMLKITGTKLELISDIDKHLLFEKGLTEGISYIWKRFSEANNKYMKTYDPTRENGFILDLDENNLYGWGISQYLPYCKFKWLRNVDKFDVNSTSENSLKGYIIEVDLKYPDELRYLHNDYPFAPAKRGISYDMLLNYCKKVSDKYGI